MEKEKQFTVGENLKVFTFDDRLKQVINECGLPISTIYYVLNNITNNIKELYNQQINTEYNEYNKHVEAQKENENKEK